MKRVALGLGGGGQIGVEGLPREVHGVRAHVAHLAGAEIPVHVPLQTIQSWLAGEVAGVERAIGRRSKPEIVVQMGWRFAFGGEIAQNPK